MQSAPPIVSGTGVGLRPLTVDDLDQVARFPFTVSISDSLDDRDRLVSVHADTGFWLKDSGALGVIETDTGRLVGTTQFYRSGACIHGYEIGYVIHDEADWGRGYGSEALHLMSQTLLASRPECFRLQLIIEVWNERSWRLAERSSFRREGVLRMAGYSSTVPEDCFIYSLTRYREVDRGPSDPPLEGG